MANREQHDVGLLLARLLIGAMFIAMGIYKFSDVAGVAAWLTSENMPSPDALAWGSAIVETAGGLAIAVGVWPRRVALVLALYLVAATIMFHAQHLEAAGQVTHVLKNIGLIGGLLAVWGSQGGKIRLL